MKLSLSSWTVLLQIVGGLKDDLLWLVRSLIDLTPDHLLLVDLSVHRLIDSDQLLASWHNLDGLVRLLLLYQLSVASHLTGHLAAVVRLLNDHLLNVRGVLHVLHIGVLLILLGLHLHRRLNTLLQDDIGRLL